MSNRLTGLAFLAIITAVIGGLALFFHLTQVGRQVWIDSPVVVTQIQQLGELSTVQYSVQKVVAVREPKLPLGEESLLLIVEGRVIAGIDLETIGANDVEVSDGLRVHVRLPEPKILHVYLDEEKTKVWDRSVTWWTPWVPFNPELETRARREAVKEVEAAAREMGILEQSEHNAESAIRRLLILAGAKAVVFPGAA